MLRLKIGVDLHVHTDASDSSLTVEEVLHKARENNVKILSITDHNTVDAYMQLTPISEIIIIPGIELTALYGENTQLHILGYGIDVNNKSIIKKLQTIQYSYLRAMQRMMLHINKEFDIKVQEELKKRSLKVKRKNICTIMLELTSLKNKKDIYEKYLNYHNLDLNFTYFSAADAVSLILEAGGIPILAHPNKLEMSIKNIEKLLHELKETGLAGIEVYHPSQINFEDKYLSLAQKHLFLISGGSDDHGDYTPENRIGYVGDKKLDADKITLLERINYNNEKN